MIRQYLSLVGVLGVWALSVSCTGPTPVSPLNQKINPDPPTRTAEGPVYTITAEETTHEFIPGVKTRVWAYNGTVPGPVIHANVGDLVTLHFVNKLPEPSTIHWHGLEVPASQDGSPLSQKAVMPGGTFTYKFKVFRAATYWYHSHVKNNEQVEKGLHGALIVHDPDENRRLGLPEDERMFLIDDVLLNEKNEIAAPLPSDPLDRAVTLTNGREGNLLLLNGEVQPLIPVKEGVPVRLRFVNASNSRFMRLSLEDQERVYRIGGDLGLLPEPVPVTEIKRVKHKTKPVLISDPDPSKGFMLVPGERAEILWYPEVRAGNRTINLEWHDLKRGRHQAEWSPQGVIDLRPDLQDGELPFEILANFKIEKAERTESKFPTNLRESSLLVPADVKNPKPLKITFGHSAPDHEGNVMFFAKAIKNKMGMMQGVPMMKLKLDQTLHAKVGETRVIEVQNMAAGIHPFHIHGFPFQLLETHYVDKEHPERNRVVKNDDKSWREWKDTIAVPGRPGFRMKSFTTMKLLVNFEDENRPGTLAANGGKFIEETGFSGGWLFHCHILEHARYGMATWLNLWE